VKIALSSLVVFDNRKGVSGVCATMPHATLGDDGNKGF